MDRSNKQRAASMLAGASRKIMHCRQRAEAFGASEEFIARLDGMNAEIGDMIRELEEDKETLPFRASANRQFGEGG